MNAPKVERRGAQRIAVMIDVEAEIGGDRVPATIENLSSSGALVWVDPESVDLTKNQIDRLHVAGLPPIEVAVKWAFFDGSVGLEFADPSGAQSPAFEAWLDASLSQETAAEA